MANLCASEANWINDSFANNLYSLLCFWVSCWKRLVSVKLCQCFELSDRKKTKFWIFLRFRVLMAFGSILDFLLFLFWTDVDGSFWKWFIIWANNDVLLWTEWTMIDNNMFVFTTTFKSQITFYLQTFFGCFLTKALSTSR